MNTGEDINNFFSEWFLNGLAYDADNGAIRENEEHCDCHYCDTGWIILKVTSEDEKLFVTLADVYGNDTVTIIYS